MKTLLATLLTKVRLALLVGLGRFVIAPLIRALIRRLMTSMARQASSPMSARPAYARSQEAPRDGEVIEGQWRRISGSGDRRQNW